MEPVRSVHETPSVLVITCWPLPYKSMETATNTPPPNATWAQVWSLPVVSCVVHVMPSGLVITRLPVPVAATATNTPFPNATLFQMFEGVVCRVQVSPPVASEAAGSASINAATQASSIRIRACIDGPARVFVGSEVRTSIRGGGKLL